MYYIHLCCLTINVIIINNIYIYMLLCIISKGPHDRRGDGPGQLPGGDEHRVRGRRGQRYIIVYRIVYITLCYSRS